jgi:hypothetical protein
LTFAADLDRAVGKGGNAQSMFPVSICDGSRGRPGPGLVALRSPGERPGLPVSGVKGVRRPELLDPSGESISCRTWYGLSAGCQLSYTSLP